MTATFMLEQADSPLLISVPHAGTALPDGLLERLNPAVRALPDTDWWIDQLWQPTDSLDAGFLVARYSRYVVDLNRSPTDEALYAGPGTGLVPLNTFSGEPVYRPGFEPDSAEVRTRVEQYWQPYHQALVGELERIRERHGFAVLLDAHSIRSRVPRLFEGQLPDLNLGSNDGGSAAPDLIRSALAWLQQWPGCSCVLDGRFKGGYITRQYGRPDRAVHGLQLEMSQRIYMQEHPPNPSQEDLERIRALATGFLRRLLAWRPPHG